MKKLLVFMLLLSAGAFAQVKPFLQDSQTISVSGNSININNPWAYITGGFYEVISGAPASVTITIKGCFRGDTTCTDGDTLDTYTTVANSIRKPSATIGYDFFQVTASWTGGTNPTVQIKTTLSAAKKGGGAAAVGTASQIQATDGAGNLVASSVTADSSGNLNAAAGIQYFHDPVNGDGVPNSASGTTNGLCGEPVVNGGVQQIQTGATTNTGTPCWPVVKQRVGTVFNGCTSACTTGFAYVISTTGQSAAIQLDNTCTGVSATGTLGHLVIRSTSAAGKYSDSGQTAISSIASGTWVAGRCVTSGSGTQTVVLEPQVAGGAGGGTAYSIAGFNVGASGNGGLSPLASTTYYYGFGQALSTVDTRKNVMLTAGAGTVTKFCFGFLENAGTAGTATVSLRKNNTTDYGTTLSWDGATTSGQSCTSASTMSISDGDFLGIKAVTPAWATPPTAVLVWWTAYITVP